MSLVLLADAQARSGSTVTQDMIDGVEAALAAEIGPLIGMRTESFFLEDLKRPSRVNGVYLTRRTDSITATTDGVPLVTGTDYRLLNGYVVDLLDTGWYGDELAVTYTPNDEGLIKEVVYDLLTFQTLPANLQSVRIGQYSETYFPNGSTGNTVWGAQIARVLPGSGMGLTSPYRYTDSTVHRSLITP